MKSLPALLALVLTLVTWQILVPLLGIPPFLLPTPIQIADSMWRDFPELLSALLSSSFCAISGFLLSAVIGIGLSLLLSSFLLLEQALYPYAVFFQTVPIVAIAPLLVIWFGYGSPTVTASAFIVSIFPVITNTLGGIRSTDIPLRELFKLYGASRWDTLWKLKFPFALPQIFTGLRISAGLAVIGTIVGEFVAGGGLGGIVDSARTQQRVDKVFAAVALGSVLGMVLIKTIEIASRLSLRHWHAEHLKWPSV